MTFDFRRLLLEAYLKLLSSDHFLWENILSKFLFSSIFKTKRFLLSQ